MESNEYKRRTRRPNFPLDLKVRLASLACEPGVSVAQLAQAHSLNANMLFKWRREFRAGTLVAQQRSTATLLPVSVVSTEAVSNAKPARSDGRFNEATTSTPVAARLEIRIADAIIGLHSSVDEVMLRTVVAVLRS